MSKKFTSIAAEAWHATKFDTDPEFDAIPNLDFKSKLQFSADKVVSSGTAITNFEKEVAKLHAEQTVKAADIDSPEYGGPMAVTEVVITNPGAGAGSDAVEKAVAEAKTDTKKVDSKAEAKADSKVDVKAADKTSKAVASIVKEESTAPVHP